MPRALLCGLELLSCSAVFVILLSIGLAEVDLDLLIDGLGDFEKLLLMPVLFFTFLGCIIFLILVCTKVVALLEIDGSLKYLVTVVTYEGPQLLNSVPEY